jgi:hypothetical protein
MALQAWEAEVYLQSIHNLDARRGWVVSTNGWPFYPRQRSVTRCSLGWMDHRAGLDAHGKSC